MTVNLTTEKKQISRSSEEGAALAIAIIVLALIMAVSIAVLAVANTETGITASDTRRTQTFYAATSSIEFMTSNFSDLFTRKARPTAQDLINLENNKPASLEGAGGEGFQLTQEIDEDTVRLAELRREQGLTTTQYPYVTIPAGSSLEGLSAAITPYIMKSTALQTSTGTKVTVQRQMNNYQVPLFQFGIFGNNDVEFHPGPKFTFNGRVHSNRNLYIGGGDMTLEDKVTSAQEVVFGTDRNGAGRSSTVKVKVKFDLISMTKGSVTGGPNFNGSGTAGARGVFPDSPNGTVNNNWDVDSIKKPTSASDSDKFGRQVLSRSTGASKLLLPLQLDGATPREIIKRPLPGESDNLSNSRYHNKAKIRILLDDETAGYGTANIAGIGNNSSGVQKGVALSAFDPIALPISGNTVQKNAIMPIFSDGTYDANAYMCAVKNATTCVAEAKVVRGIRNYITTQAQLDDCTITTRTCVVPAGSANGSGLTGRILIEMVKYNDDGTEVTTDVTKQILSMGMTVGEPNAIVHLQRPLWAAFIPASRTRGTVGLNNLVDLIAQTGTSNLVNDGELKAALFDATYGYIKSTANPITDDDSTTGYGGNQIHNRFYVPDTNPTTGRPYDAIVPINIYNVREGWSAGWQNSNQDSVTERGMTSVVELNMKNLSRWLAGYYDNNLLAGTPAVSSTIIPDDGFTVYVSDRRGDKVKDEYTLYNSDSSPIITSKAKTTNGIVDNEDVYSNNFGFASLDIGEDVIAFGTDPLTAQTYKGFLQNDLTELPLPYPAAGVGTPDFPVPQTGNLQDRLTNAKNKILSWTNSKNYFRRSVRLFNGEDLNPGFGTKLGEESGITVASENMVYIWGNYNTSGIVTAPTSGSTTNNGGYSGDQVPASIVSDAFFPLSRTWFDGLSALYPNGNNREADTDIPASAVGSETAVRAAIIAGTTMSGLAGEPDQLAGTNGNGESHLAGGVHNFPRFSEKWGQNRRWNYTGSLILLYYSNQAVGPYNATTVIYDAPNRNWSFDTTFKNPKRLPPGTPFFQFVQPTGFRQLIDPNATPTPTP